MSRNSSNLCKRTRHVDTSAAFAKPNMSDPVASLSHPFSILSTSAGSHGLLLFKTRPHFAPSLRACFLGISCDTWGGSKQWRKQHSLLLLSRNIPTSIVCQNLRFSPDALDWFVVRITWPAAGLVTAWPGLRSFLTPFCVAVQRC